MSTDILGVRSLQWLEHGFTVAGGELQSRLVDFATDNKETMVAAGITALALGTMYTAYRACVRMGQTKPMGALPSMKEVVIAYKDGTEKTIPHVPGMKLEGRILDNVGTVSTRTLSPLSVLERQIDTLQTREEIIAWLIKYQHLTMPGQANGKDIVNGTVACGFAAALRVALAAENMKLVDDSANIALVGTLDQLRNTKQLSLLNETALEAHRKLQKIEGPLHQEWMEFYDTIGKISSNINPEIRGFVACAYSKLPTEISTATLGASRVGVPVVTKGINLLKGIGSFMVECSGYQY